MGEVILRNKADAAVAVIKLRAGGFECKVVPPPARLADKYRDFQFLMIWRDYPGEYAGDLMADDQAWDIMVKFCCDVDDVIAGPHDDGRMEDRLYAGIVQTADIVPDGHVPEFDADYSEAKDSYWQA